MRYFSFNYNAIAYSIRIVLGCIIVWWSLYYMHDNKKIWALISVIVVSDPDFGLLRTATISRIVNTIVGCIIGLAFIYLLPMHVWSLLAALAVAVVISTSFKNFPTSWKLAPTTVLIVMMPAMTEHVSWHEAMWLAISRTGEILYGSLIAFILGYVFLKIRQALDKYEFRKLQPPKP